MKNKKIWIAAIVLVVVIACFLGIYFATRPDTTAGAKTFTVTVVHADGTSKDFTYHTDEEYLGAALLAEGLIAGEESEFGLYVTAVDGETADYNTDGSYWAFFVGEEYAQLGVDQTPVNDGGTFRLVYTVSGAE